MTKLSTFSSLARISILMMGVAAAPMMPVAMAEETGLLAVGDAVVTGFSGVIEPELQEPSLTKAQNLDETFIDPSGISARINNLATPGYIWDARAWQGESYFDIKAKDIGQVFGVTIDDAEFPNIYLTATSAFGLHRVLPDADNDGRPERIKVGEPGTDWMEGMWGKADETKQKTSQGGPGSIWKVDGKTGAVTLFASVQREGKNNPGAGLGNITYVRTTLSRL